MAPTIAYGVIAKGVGLAWAFYAATRLLRLRKVCGSPVTPLPPPPPFPAFVLLALVLALKQWLQHVWGAGLAV